MAVEEWRREDNGKTERGRLNKRTQKHDRPTDSARTSVGAPTIGIILSDESNNGTRVWRAYAKERGERKGKAAWQVVACRTKAHVEWWRQSWTNVGHRAVVISQEPSFFTYTVDHIVGPSAAWLQKLSFAQEKPPQIRLFWRAGGRRNASVGDGRRHACWPSVSGSAAA